LSGETGFTTASSALIEDLFVANRILSDHKLVDGFGHVSARHDRDLGRYVMTRNLAAGLVTPDDIVEFDLDSRPIRDIGVGYSVERFIHGEIYRSRPDVMAIVHSHAAPLILFSVIKAPLRPLYHVASFLEDGAPIFDIRDAAGMTDLLIRTPELGRSLAQTLADKSVVLMRGHGATIVGASIKHVVFKAVYTMQNAELQRDAMCFGEVTYLAPEEAALSTAFHAKAFERPWEFWKRQAFGQ
jgi:ribulose-5-phosphate 4-epimerase/fuculose-1-phosphate aldolase